MFHVDKTAVISHEDNGLQKLRDCFSAACEKSEITFLLITRGFLIYDIQDKMDIFENDIIVRRINNYNFVSNDLC